MKNLKQCKHHEFQEDGFRLDSLKFASWVPIVVMEPCIRDLPLLRLCVRQGWHGHMSCDEAIPRRWNNTERTWKQLNTHERSIALTCIARPLSFCLAKDSCRGHSASRRPCTSCSDSSHKPDKHGFHKATHLGMQHQHTTVDLLLGPASNTDILAKWARTLLAAEMCHIACVCCESTCFDVWSPALPDLPKRRKEVLGRTLPSSHLPLSVTRTIYTGHMQLLKCGIERLDNNETKPFCTCQNVRNKLESRGKVRIMEIQHLFSTSACLF